MTGTWSQLNERQQQFLLALYTCECDAAHYYLRPSMIFDPRRKGGEWRWIEHGVTLKPPRATREMEEFWPGNRELGKALRAQGIEDQGIGSTFKSLAERGLLETRETTFEVPLLGKGVLLWAQLTRKGRACVKPHSTAHPPLRKTPEQVAAEKRAKRDAFERATALRQEEWDLLMRGRDLAQRIKPLVFAELTIQQQRRAPRPDSVATAEVAGRLRELYSQLEQANLFPDHLSGLRCNDTPPEWFEASDQQEHRRCSWIGLLFRIRTRNFVYDLLHPS